MTPSDRARAQLAAWPHLAQDEASCGVGVALSAAGREIVHLHEGAAVDVRLTETALTRFAEELRSARSVRLNPGATWITVQVHEDRDIDLLLMLVSVALQAHADRWPAPPLTRCSINQSGGRTP